MVAGALARQDHFAEADPSLAGCLLIPGLQNQEEGPAAVEKKKQEIVQRG